MEQRNEIVATFEIAADAPSEVQAQARQLMIDGLNALRSKMLHEASTYTMADLDLVEAMLAE